MAIVWNIPIACNRASADFMVSSPLMDGEYYRLVPDYETYRPRKLDGDTVEAQKALMQDDLHNHVISNEE